LESLKCEGMVVSIRCICG